MARIARINDEDMAAFGAAGLLLALDRGPDRRWVAGWLAVLLQDLGYTDLDYNDRYVGYRTWRPDTEWLRCASQNRATLSAAWRLGGARALLAMAGRYGLRRG